MKHLFFNALVRMRAQCCKGRKLDLQVFSCTVNQGFRGVRLVCSSKLPPGHPPQELEEFLADFHERRRRADNHIGLLSVMRHGQIRCVASKIVV